MGCPSGGRGPLRERDRNYFSRSGSRRRGGGGGGEGERQGGEEGAWGRGCWTARTMGGSVGNLA